MNQVVPRPHAEDPLERARRHAEANLFEPLTLAGLAAVAGLSAYHFTRQFSARFGESPMAHVRTRRLARAADRLAEAPQTSLVQLAFDCGFDSQEGFTRAFARTFGVPPGRYRRIANPKEAPMPALADLKPNLSEGAGPVRKPALRIAGVSRVFDETNKHEIPLLWGRLFGLWPALAQGGRRTFGVSCAEPQADGACLHYTAGAALKDGEAAPPGLELLEIPAQTYLVYRQVMDGTDLHRQMQAGMKEIWGERVPRSGHVLVQAPDLEVYPEDFQPDRPGAWVEWWLPVEG